MLKTRVKIKSLDYLKPVPQMPPNNTIVIEPGIFYKTDGKSIIELVTATVSPVFTPVSPGNVRIDVLSMNGSLTLNRTIGV
jgi:hypothetical protein